MGLSNNENMLGIVSDYAKVLLNDKRLMLADKIAPVVRVPTVYGFYPAFDSALAVTDMKYVPGTEAKQINTLKTDTVYDCDGRALQIAITDAELARNNGNGGTEQSFYETRVASLISRAFTTFEKEVWDYAIANVAATATKTWSTPTSGTPLADIMTLVNTIRDASGNGGVMRMFLGNAAWKNFFAHGDVKGNLSYSTIPTMESVAAMLKPYGIDEFYISNTGASGTNILNAEVFIALCNDNGTLSDNSGMKQFRFEPTQAQDYLEVISDPIRSQEIVRLKWYYDLQITNSSGIKRYTIN